MRLSGVGDSVLKSDALAKVTGAAIFAADIKRPGLAFAKVVRSEIAHAVIEDIDVAAAAATPGVLAVLTAKDIPGTNGVGIIIKDEPMLAGDKIRRRGDALALVVAESEKIAIDAGKKVRVTCKELPAYFDPYAAMATGAVPLHGSSNVLTVRKIRKGDVEAAFAASAVIVEKRYTTQWVEHAYIEPEAGVAEYDGNVITIWVSSQNVHFDRREVARNMDLGVHQVRIVQAVTGGGFGGKLDISVQCYLALAAYKTRRPVKMVWQREESMTASAKRHPYWIDYKVGADASGKWLALKATVVGDSGAYASYGPAVLTRAAVHATGPYEVPNVFVDAYAVYTNNPQAGAMRGFGVPQMAFAHESHMDLLAEELGMPPYAIRAVNVLRPGGTTATGQVLNHSVGIEATLNQACAQADKLFRTGVL
ncbi:xanthine dehydrogenase family protein molybdopterin-binding subunit [Anaeroselena agilis]|uniref:xanthine dehydrogenase family protein molybdopterin-binding subunit n=1 Tax=Anaeroselena agilis TaxID=3063788 RepID=UPI0039B6F839